MTDGAAGLLLTVSFYNHSLLNISRIAIYDVFYGNTLIHNYSMTIWNVFVPETPTAAPVQLPTFMCGVGITRSNDTVPHTQSDIASALSAIYLNSSAPSTSLQSHSNLKKLLAHNK
jgi:hypothetical protein